MSLAEIESKVLALTEEERRQFAEWFYENEGRIAGTEEGEEMNSPDEISSEMMEELLRRRKELEDGTAEIISLDEMFAGMQEAVDEVRRSRN